MLVTSCKRLFRDLLQSFKIGFRNMRNTCKKPARKLQPFAPVVRLAIFKLQNATRKTLKINQT